MAGKRLNNPYANLNLGIMEGLIMPSTTGDIEDSFSVSNLTLNGRGVGLACYSDLTDKLLPPDTQRIFWGDNGDSYLRLGIDGELYIKHQDHGNPDGSERLVDDDGGMLKNFFGNLDYFDSIAGIVSMDSAYLLPDGTKSSHYIYDMFIISGRALIRISMVLDTLGNRTRKYTIMDGYIDYGKTYGTGNKLNKFYITNGDLYASYHLGVFHIIIFNDNDPTNPVGTYIDQNSLNLSSYRAFSMEFNSNALILTCFERTSGKFAKLIRGGTENRIDEKNYGPQNLVAGSCDNLCITEQGLVQGLFNYEKVINNKYAYPGYEPMYFWNTGNSYLSYQEQLQRFDGFTRPNDNSSYGFFRLFEGLDLTYAGTYEGNKLWYDNTNSRILTFRPPKGDGTDIFALEGWMKLFSIKGGDISHVKSLEKVVITGIFPSGTKVEFVNPNTNEVFYTINGTDSLKKPTDQIGYSHGTNITTFNFTASIGYFTIFQPIIKLYSDETRTKSPVILSINFITDEPIYD